MESTNQCSLSNFIGMLEYLGNQLPLLSRAENMSGDISSVISYKFNNLSLLETALTHPSFIEEGIYAQHYQRLEFLGDRILSLVIATILYEHFPDDTEGTLTLKLIQLVRKETIAGVAKDMNILPYIRINDEQAGIINDSILCDVVEAIVGAIYVDSNIESAATFINKYWSKYTADLAIIDKDAKSLLQEWSQKNLKALPKYRVIESAGPAHAPSFLVEVKVGDHNYTAIGPSKKKAELDAASKCLKDILASHSQP